MKIMISLLLIVFFTLQYRLWVGEGSFAEVVLLKEKLTTQQAELDKLKQRNAKLQGEVADLISGKEAIEEIARSELGLIGENEVFYQVLEKP
jgi:cell division protein FtsB